MDTLRRSITYPGARVAACTEFPVNDLDRAVRDEAHRLADPRHDWAAPCARPGGKHVAAAWRTRRVALAAYHDQLAAQRDPLPVLRSLLHVHHVRAIGADPDRERITHQLARAAALRWTAQHRG